MLAIALSLAVLVVRAALFQAYVLKDPARIGSFWPGHPTAILDTGLAELGSSAASGKAVSPALVRRLLDASAKAPLAPEPFLIRGVQAQLAGNQDLALQSFLAARERSPRTVAARYFLADHYLKTGQAGPGLAEVSILARLVPQSVPTVVPFLAAFARSSGAAPQMKILLRSHPELEPVLLDTLSQDPANAGLVLNLWSGRNDEQSKAWQGRLLNQMVNAGRFDLARETWTKFSGASAGSGQLFDPDFSKKTLPPFGWNLLSGSTGVAEAEGGGRLHILYFGRDDAVLASQLLMLQPGAYRLAMKVEIAAAASKPLEWTITCAPARGEIERISLGRFGAVEAVFEVPANCPVQRLELIATAPEFPEQTDLTISELGLLREGSK